MAMNIITVIKAITTIKAFNYTTATSFTIVANISMSKTVTILMVKMKIATTVTTE